MIKILYIGVGGFLGASLRYLIGGWVHKMLDKAWFPFGTFTVNMLGCFIIGLLMGMAESRQFLTPEARLFLVTGLLGSLTTFSTFAYESVDLFWGGETIIGLANIGFQVVVGLGLVYFGLALSRAV